MAAVNESNIGLYLGWAYGEDNWNTGMDTNMSILGGMSQLYVKSRSTSVKPVSPTNGDRYYVPVGATGDWSAYEKNIAIYSSYHSAWKYVPAKAGFEFRVEDEANSAFYYDGSALVSSVSLAGYLTAASAYTASGLVTFSTVPKISGSHSVDTTEVATVGDIDTAIAAQNFSTFVRTTGAQSIAGVKTFTSPISGVDALASSDLATLSQVDTAVDAIALANIGAGVGVAAGKVGDTLNFKTLIAGTNVSLSDSGSAITLNVPNVGVVDAVVAGAGISIDNTDPENPVITNTSTAVLESVVAGTGITVDNTDPANPVIAASGGSFDATANQTITGEWIFNTAGNKDHLVTDDPTLAAPLIAYGVLDHNAVVNPTGVYVPHTFKTTAGANRYDSYINVEDDGSVGYSLTIDNASGSATDITILTVGGVTTRTLVVDKFIVTTEAGDTNGFSATVGVDTTITAIDGHSSLGDYVSAKAGASGTVAPNFLLNKDIAGGATAKFGIGTSTVYGLEVTRDSGNLITEKLYTPNGKIEISQDTDGTAANIVLQANGTGVVSIVNPIKNTGNKTGTLASPPAGMVIGEIWADTTDSATHPILRISTTTT